MPLLSLYHVLFNISFYFLSTFLICLNISFYFLLGYIFIRRVIRSVVSFYAAINIKIISRSDSNKTTQSSNVIIGRQEIWISWNHESEKIWKRRLTVPNTSRRVLLYFVLGMASIRLTRSFEVLFVNCLLYQKNVTRESNNNKTNAIWIFYRVRSFVLTECITFRIAITMIWKSIAR